MQSLGTSAPLVRGDRFYYHLLFGAAFPFLLASEALQRLSAGAEEDGSRRPAFRSVFAEARSNTLIAISYAVMARSTLRTSARHNGPERLS